MDVCNCKLVLKVRFTSLGSILIQRETEKKKEVTCLQFDWKPEICASVPVVLPRGGLGTVPRLLKFKMMAGTVPRWSESEVDLSIG